MKILETDSEEVKDLKHKIMFYMTEAKSWKIQYRHFRKKYFDAIGEIDHGMKLFDLPVFDGDIHSNLEYLTEKRNIILERLNKQIERHDNDEKIQSTLKNVLRMNRQVKLMKEALIIYNKFKK